MRWVPLAIAMLGCGSSSKPTKPIECWDCGLGPGGRDPRHLQEAQTHQALCKQARSQAAAGCAPFDQMDPSLLESCGVVIGFQLAGMETCLGEPSCDALTACFARVRTSTNPPDYAGPTRPCVLPQNDDGLAYPAGVSREEYYTSYGSDARTYADAPSTKDRPIEVCGFPQASLWLARMTCKDGSHPLASRVDAERARVGNVGEGGRCGRIIDQYTVQCPEQAFDIFIDAYRCRS